MKAKRDSQGRFLTGATGVDNGMFDKKHSLETIIRMKKAHGNDADRFKEAYEEKSISMLGLGNPFYGKHHTEESKVRMSKSHIGVSHSQSMETRERISKTKIGDKNPFYGKKHSEETLHILRTKSRQKWLDHSYVVKIRHGRSLEANKVEIRLQDIIGELNLPYRYTGDGQFSIGAKIPDFVNINGQKKVIELLGCYWHGCKQCYPNIDRVNDFEERVKLFKDFGYSTLGIWEHEFIDCNSVKQKLIEFEEIR
jgi:G:T-mismatch repair DNA endonuclease (very short patch repair protein)